MPEYGLLINKNLTALRRICSKSNSNKPSTINKFLENESDWERVIRHCI